jgi:hypothetical protein
MGSSVRRALARGSIAAALIAGGAAVTTHQSANAGGGGTVKLTARCASDGSPDGYAHLEEHFTGLTYGQPQYGVVGTRDVQGGSDTWSDGNGWYPEPDGSYNTPDDYYVPLFVTSVDTDFKQGQVYHWQLSKTYGTTTVVQTGDVTVGGPNCVKHEKPKPPKLANSPSKVTVNKHGKFTYDFKATPTLKGTVTVSKGASTWATKDFVVPDAGKVKAKLILKKKAFKKLMKAGQVTTDVVVLIKDGPKHSKAHATLVLKAP